MHYPIAKISFEDSIYENRINVSNIDFEVTPSSYDNQPFKPIAIHILYTFLIVTQRRYTVAAGYINQSWTPHLDAVMP